MGILRNSSFLLASSLAFCLSAGAQQKSEAILLHSRAYDVTRESALQGTVLEYKEASSAAPFGAHVILQTSAGTVDAHLGNSKVLQAKHLSLSTGDNVRIVGENLVFNHGTIFVVRIIQKGSQSVTLRSKNGLLLANTTVPSKNGNAAAQPVGVR